MAALRLIGVRRCLRTASVDALAAVNARALTSSQCSCSYAVLEIHRPFTRSSAQASTKQSVAQSAASTAWMSDPGKGKPGQGTHVVAPARQGGTRSRTRSVDFVQQKQQLTKLMSSISPGIVAEPFKGEGPNKSVWGYLSTCFTKSGRQEIKQEITGWFKTAFAIAKFRKAHKGFNMVVFREHALALYTEVCSALATGDHAVLRQAATPKHYSILKRQLAARQEGGWTRVAWGLAQQPALDDVHLIQARLLMMDPKARPRPLMGPTQIPSTLTCTTCRAPADAGP